MDFNQLATETLIVNRRAALIFVALGVAWGIPYLLIKVAVAELPPETLVLARTALAAAVLLPIALARGAVLPVLRRWRPLLAYTVLEICIPWLFLTRAEQVLPSSTTGLLIAAVPVVASVLAVLGSRITGEARERLGIAGTGGLLLGILGVAALVGLDIGGSSVPAVAQVGLVVLGYAIGPVILRRYLSDLPGIGVVAVSLAGAALAYLPMVLAGPGLPTALPSADVLVSVTVLALVCTAIAFLLLFALVNEIGPVRATAITYLNPAVAVVAGAAVLHETVTIWTGIGFALVLTGSFLVTRRPTATPLDDRTAPPPVATPAQAC
jgi:drug/metabolite transporter (DMT)-like permease